MSLSSSIQTAIVASPAGHDLSGAQLWSFRRGAFLSLDSLMPADEVVCTRATLERPFDIRAGYEEGVRFDFLSAEDDLDRPAMPQILRPSMFAPELLRGRPPSGPRASPARCSARRCGSRSTTC